MFFVENYFFRQYNYFVICSYNAKQNNPNEIRRNIMKMGLTLISLRHFILTCARYSDQPSHDRNTNKWHPKKIITKSELIWIKIRCIFLGKSKRKKMLVSKKISILGRKRAIVVVLGES